jgi:hypothetical protein
MKRQISSLVFGAIVAAGVSVAAPQEPNAPAPQAQGQARQHGQRAAMDPNHVLARMTKQLNLTSDQQKQILPILTDRQQQFESIRSDKSLSDTDRRTKMETLRTDTQTKIKNVLNDDQKKQYEELQQKMQDRAREHREDNVAPNAPPPSSNQ